MLLHRQCPPLGSSSRGTPSRSRAAPPVLPVPCQHPLHAKPVATRTTCHAALDDAAAAAADAATAAATAAERRRLREQRRAARQQQEGVLLEASQEEAESDAVDPAADLDEPASSLSQPAGQPGPGSSRLAARRQQRARLLRGASSRSRRVPDALVPDDAADAYGESDEDEEDSSGTGSGSSSDEDAGGDPTSSSSAGAGGQEDPEEAQTQLPQSVMQQAAAAGLRGRKPRQQQASSGTSQHQQQGGAQQQEGGAQQREGRQQQQRGKGGSRGAEGGAPEPLMLQETNPMYLPVLTDEDLDADPPGHKSGYVAVIGRPNAGKSTLINAIVGQKLSIVTYKPQTTRHRVVGIASDKEYQMILFDTPGIMQEQRSKLDERMMAAVVSSIKAAEVIIAVVDASDDPQEALAMFQPGPDWSGPPMAVLLNKTDLLGQEQIQELQDWYLNNCRAEKVFVGSALESSDAGVEAIKAWAVDKLPEGPTLYPKSMVSEQPERFFVSEIIREQIFVQYDQEIPYACQVQIADFKERRGAKDYIEAVILVERETQAPIVLGRGGAAIKKLGSAARQQIEEFLGRKVYLELSVQVAPAWRQQADKLKDFGYYDALYVS